ncbi:MAG: cytochrome-c peroxidase [Chitinophagales bacterium]|nr:cytochrome-c peroxidase [Chitinophagales bacterium]
MKIVNKMIKILLSIVFLGQLIGCKPKDKLDRSKIYVGKDSIQALAANLFQVLPDSVPNPDNPLSFEKIALGKMLYYDTKLSNKGNNSCNSCHNLSTFGVDNKSFSVGDDGLNGGRNSPTVLNAALHAFQFWDGRAKDVEEQAGMPILNPIEMHIPNERFLEEKLKNDPNYVKLFKEAFPDASAPLTYEHIRMAIAAFERTLLTPSRFDDYLAGNKDALTQKEKTGLNTFISIGCTTCHSGVALGGNMFQKFGVFGNYWEFTKSAKIDSGRVSITKNNSDVFVFKTPSLRNIEKTYPYFHDGSVSDLKSAISIMAKLQLNKTLSEEEVTNIEAFLQSLTGKVPEDALVNPF